MLSSSSQTEPSKASAAKLDDVLAQAEKLETKDQMRLIATLWESLPPKNRAAILAFGLENFQYSTDVKSPSDVERALSEPKPPAIWNALFDPTNTSELYSAPKRFDLATIFVMTAAYSLVLGFMALFQEFGPVTKAAVVIFITIVGVCQAFYQNIANPRGVSIVTGAIAQTVILIILGATHNWFYTPVFVVVVIYGIVAGAIFGYFAGTIVGGVFLVADMLRKRFVRPSDTDADAVRPDSDSPFQS
jgi:hypothetical protein